MMHGDQHEFSLKRCEYSSAAIRIPFAESYDPSQQRFPPAPNWQLPCAALVNDALVYRSKTGDACYAGLLEQEGRLRCVLCGGIGEGARAGRRGSASCSRI